MSTTDDRFGAFFEQHGSWLLLYVRSVMRRFHRLPATLTDAHDAMHAFLLHGLARGWFDRPDVVHEERLYRVMFWRWLRGECRREGTRRARFQRGVRAQRIRPRSGEGDCPLCRLVTAEALPKALPVAVDRFRRRHPAYEAVLDAVLDAAPQPVSADALAERLRVPRRAVKDRLHRMRSAFRVVLAATLRDMGLEPRDFPFGA